MDAAPRLFLVAAEESGDRLGGALMTALREQARPDIQFSGVGGHDMAARGLASLFPIDELSIMGFVSIPRRLPNILRRIRETSDAVIAARPDALVIIDSPDFTHRVARRVRRADPSIPIVDYVSPSVWAWRPGRARAMRSYVDHVLALLPFEPQAHRDLGGPLCTYVGHPLAAQVAELRPNAAETQRRSSDPPVILVLPGSRSGEIRRHSAIFGAAVSLVRERIGPIEIVVPTVPHLAGPLVAETASWPVQPRIAVEPADKQAAFRLARAALAKSGTVTLEVALAGVPMVAAYRGSPIEAWAARRLVRLPSYILANLVLGENVVTELIQQDCTAERLAAELIPLIGHTVQRARQIEAFARLDTIMEVGARAPAARAAEIVLGLLRPAEQPFGGSAPNRISSTHP